MISNKNEDLETRVISPSRKRSKGLNSSNNRLITDENII